MPLSAGDDKLERVSTGIDRLDGVLDGGIPRYSVVFIAGLPGTGKTILSQQMLFSNGRAGKTCLYLSTISESPLKVLRFQQSFGFFEPELFGSKVIYGDVGSALLSEGAAGFLRQVDGLVRQHRPEVLVIDSFKAVRDIVRDPLAFRELTSDLAVRLAAWEVTALLVGEYSAEDVRASAEFAIADGIIYLYGTEEPERQKRYLRVMKMRGTSHFGGEHYFDIGPQGITLYPRMGPQVVGEYEAPMGRIGSAIDGLGAMLGGGLLESTSTLISGSSGTGKTLMAISFLVASAGEGRPGLLVSLEESPLQIRRNCESFCWDLGDLVERKLLDVFHVSPSELNVDRHAFEIRERAEQVGARVVAIDSITAFRAAVPEVGKYQSYLWAINDHFKRMGVAIIMTNEMVGSWAPVEFTSEGVSFIADNSILLRQVEAHGQARWVVRVLKMRGSQHDRRVRELIIQPPRVAIGAPLGSRRRSEQGAGAGPGG